MSNEFNVSEELIHAYGYLQVRVKMYYAKKLIKKNSEIINNIDWNFTGGIN